jgi:hypothetical protein
MVPALPMWAFVDAEDAASKEIVPELVHDENW